MHRRIGIEEAGDDPAAGTGEYTDDDSADTSAETITTDTDEDEDRGPIPYARFKEVNDERKELLEFRELSDVGYDADSLRQLAEFNARFETDPVGMWLAVGGQIEGLPDPVKEAIQSSQSGASSGQPPVEGEAGANRDEEDRVARLEARLDEKEAAEQKAQWDSTLDKLMSDWRTADKEDQLEESPPEEVMLTYIEKHARGAKDLEDILTRARGAHTEYVNKLLGRAVSKRGAGRKAPVPSGGASPANTPEPPKTLEEASRMARLELQRLSAEQRGQR